MMIPGVDLRASQMNVVTTQGATMFLSPKAIQYSDAEAFARRGILRHTSSHELHSRFSDNKSLKRLYKDIRSLQVTGNWHENLNTAGGLKCVSRVVKLISNL